MMPAWARPSTDQRADKAMKSATFSVTTARCSVVAIARSSSSPAPRHRSSRLAATTLKPALANSEATRGEWCWSSSSFNSPAIAAFAPERGLAVRLPTVQSYALVDLRGELRVIVHRRPDLRGGEP